MTHQKTAERKLTSAEIKRAYAKAARLVNRKPGALTLRAVRRFDEMGASSGYDTRRHYGDPTGYDYELLSQVRVPDGAILDLEISERGEWGEILDWTPFLCNILHKHS